MFKTTAESIATYNAELWIINKGDAPEYMLWIWVADVGTANK